MARHPRAPPAPAPTTRDPSPPARWAARRSSAGAYVDGVAGGSPRTRPASAVNAAHGRGTLTPTARAIASWPPGAMPRRELCRLGRGARSLATVFKTPPGASGGHQAAKLAEAPRSSIWRMRSAGYASTCRRARCRVALSSDIQRCFNDVAWLRSSRRLSAPCRRSVESSALSASSTCPAGSGIRRGQVDARRGCRASSSSASARRIERTGRAPRPGASPSSVTFGQAETPRSRATAAVPPRRHKPGEEFFFRRRRLKNSLRCALVVAIFTRRQLRSTYCVDLGANVQVQFRERRPAATFDELGSKRLIGACLEADACLRWMRSPTGSP